MINEFSAVAFLLLSGCAASTPHDETVSRISVSFVEPEKYTDARRTELAPTSAGVLRELQKFLVETGPCYLPKPRRLNIRVTDVDLAGDFELFRGPQTYLVRITKGLYPPRMMLEFEIIDGAAVAVRSGRRDLADINYQFAALTRERTICGMKRISYGTGCATSLVF